MVARRAASPLGDFEAIAARVIARLTGGRVVIQDDGSADRMPDIRIEHRCLRPTFVEVWTDTNPSYAAMYSSLMKAGNGLPLELTMPGLVRVWWVVISGSANVVRLRAELGPLLAELEREGLTFERTGEVERSDDPRLKELSCRGVVRVSSRPRLEGEPGTIRLLPNGISGSPTIAWDSVVDWLGRTMFSARFDDVRSKLAATGAGARHAFVGPTFSSPSDVFFALGAFEESLPHDPPDLPPEITHLWLMRVSPPGRCLAWFPSVGWFDVSRRWATP